MITRTRAPSVRAKSGDITFIPSLSYISLIRRHISPTLCPPLPLALEIIACQIHRIEHLRRQPR